MRVQIVEVGPRDGLQNESAIVPAAAKIVLIHKLMAAGLKRIEASSFVNPKWIPQLADADEVLQGINRSQEVTLSALVPNVRGLERARQCGLTEIALFMSASETHNQKNINKRIEDTYPILREVAQEALALGMKVRGYISTVFGCPYEGNVPLDNSRRVTEALLEMGVYEISLGDTIGVATPKQVHEVFGELVKDVTNERLAAHFHDTRGTGLANVAAALEEGIRIFDSSIGGLGGCPYAPGAAGNISTEDLVYMLHGMDYETGIDLEKLIEAGAYIGQQLGKELPSKVLRASLASKPAG
ncbi:hydroxymethylglutaryl-CoA lyase [Brevibacillus formosus]|uniref:hydroxymethylglutaryl-CoA lyase n=1 Tax=Brevibacillus TaxID=55080 RepID=UPI000D109FCE|nr:MULTISPECIES: hydroxymethylglutaryl-CoA lyase [Brevibacillus]MBG9944846.1 hydroxymethylglutaryl-CoA lyase [Brevibacillus formosus]MBW5469853.1 hydroxymethylglutaryl-CoA lyase [Brevibacillus formosus]MED1947354.1 hydroxymethylglutaryl-CoA lyase [Brevibacillus formosus]MED1997379.1 hydroxymethylglutaryl-CoA lyase [Brevibacillus formosus]MED2083236.1 hydroxymethylglutaryl-CoA lyase [Brevibacillus formosus]